MIPGRWLERHGDTICPNTPTMQSANRRLMPFAALPSHTISSVPGRPAHCDARATMDLDSGGRRDPRGALRLSGRAPWMSSTRTAIVLRAQWEHNSASRRGMAELKSVRAQRYIRLHRA